MRLLAVLSILALLTGCTTIDYDRATGRVRIQRVLTDAEIGVLTVKTPDGELVVEGYRSDAEAIAEAMAGLVERTLREARP